MQIVRFWRYTFTACENSTQHFYQSPDFVTTSLQRVQFPIDGVKTCPTSSQFFKIRQILIRDFYSVSDFEIIFLAAPQFLNRKNYEASDIRKSLILGFVGTSIPHSQFLVSIYIVKTSQLALPWFPEKQYSEKEFFGEERRQFSNQSF